MKEKSWEGETFEMTVPSLGYYYPEHIYPHKRWWSPEIQPSPWEEPNIFPKPYGPTGWICPVCGGGNSPSTSKCSCRSHTYRSHTLGATGT